MAFQDNRFYETFQRHKRTAASLVMSWSFAALALIGLAIVAYVGIRDHVKLRADRRSLFDDCCNLLEMSLISHGGDDFPRLEGRHAGRIVRADLIPDSMTIRRLPQLWLSLTRLEARNELAEFALLARPAGTEFYSLTSNYTYRLEPPPGFPDEILIRGSGPGAQHLLAHVSNVVRKILADKKIKEIAVTTKGLRLVWQAGEGRRGEHLLLRQSTFDAAHISQHAFVQLLSRLDELSNAIDSVIGTESR